MQGDLAEGVLPGLIRDVYLGHKSGQLTFRRHQDAVSVVFQQGEIVRACTTVASERLGETLVRQGLLSEVDLAHTTNMIEREKKRLGFALQELGVMEPARLEEALTLHVMELIRKVFTWKEGTYDFEERDREAVDEIPLKLHTAEIILEAVRRIPDPDVIRYALGAFDRVLALSSDPLMRFQKITLTPADGYVLSRVDGTLSIREIIQVIPMIPEDTQRSLFGLLCTGVVEFLPPPTRKVAAPAVAAPAAAPPPPEPPKRAPDPPAESAAAQGRRREIQETHEGLKGKNHFEVLGIPKASSETQVKEAYFRLAKRFHPDGLESGLADLKPQLEAVFIRLGQAYETLRSARTRASYESDLAARTPRAPTAPAGAPEAPAPPDPRQNAQAAEGLIRRAEKHFAEEKYWDAIQLLEQAETLSQGKANVRCRLLLAKSYLKNPKWLKRGEEVLQGLIRDDPKGVEPYYVLGVIYKNGGLKSRSVAMFRKVLELQPDHEGALAEVASAPEPPEPPPTGGGLFRKLFGKT